VTSQAPGPGSLTGGASGPGAAAEVALAVAAVPVGARVLVLGDDTDLVGALEARGSATTSVPPQGDLSAAGDGAGAAVTRADLSGADDPVALLRAMAAAVPGGRVVLVVDDAEVARLVDEVRPVDERRPGTGGSGPALGSWPAVGDLLAAADLQVWWRVGVSADGPDELEDLDRVLLDAALGPARRRPSRHVVVAGVGPAPAGEAPLLGELAERLADAERDRDAALAEVAELGRDVQRAGALAARVAELEDELAKLRREQRAGSAVERVRGEYVAELEARLAASEAAAAGAATAAVLPGESPLIRLARRGSGAVRRLGGLVRRGARAVRHRVGAGRRGS
jgi:hypothetical protein